ncbi:MAG: glycosyltransferase family 4 protein [Propionivibrio sp.]|nr:glycosyltransferase family 4 protein [Propionivibrio sp.]
MRIVIDIQGALSPTSRHRGVGRYVVEMVRALAKANKERHELIVTANSDLTQTKVEIHQLFGEIINFENIRIWTQSIGPVDGIGGNGTRRQIAEAIREWHIYNLHPDVLWIPNLQEGWLDNSAVSINKYFNLHHVVTTLHDVIPLIYPNDYLASEIKGWYLEKISQTKKSDLILTVSRYSQNEICRRLGVSHSNVVVAENSYAAEKFYVSDINIDNVAPELESGKYVLYVGGADKHKNLETLLRAYSKLPTYFTERHPLVLVGGDLSRVKESIIAHATALNIHLQSLKILGLQTDEAINTLFNNCGVFVFPSYNEGFGLPPLEAMASGAPVLCADAASLPEIVSYPDALFNPGDPAELGDKILKSFNDYSFRESLVNNAKKRIAHYSWDKSARIVLDALETLNGPTPSSENEQADVGTLISTISNIEGVSQLDEATLIATSKAIARNSKAFTEERSIYLDISCLVHFDHATGIQRVVRAIMSSLLKRGVDGFKICPIMSYAGHENFYFTRTVDGSHRPPEETDLAEEIVEFCDGDIVIILDLHPGSLISKRNTIRDLQKSGVLFGVVVYDLLPVQFPEYFVPELCVEFKEWLGVVATADYALCISNDVAETFSRWISNEPSEKNPFLKVNHFHLGADLNASMPSKGLPQNGTEILSTLERSKSFLMVGTVEPRKGHAFVLDSFETLWDSGSPDLMLVIVGRRGWKNEELINRLLTHPESGKRLFWLEGISDEYLDLIYKSSSCLIAASEGEGFGLPLIEAAQHGIPILARDLPVFREVAQDYAYYFCSETPLQFASEIKAWLELAENDEAPLSKGMPWLTWDESAQQLLRVFLKGHSNAEAI